MYTLFCTHHLCNHHCNCRNPELVAYLEHKKEEKISYTLNNLHVNQYKFLVRIVCFCSS
jgi:hypothetical protein